MTPQQIEKLINDKIQAAMASSQYQLSRTPFHTHNKKDSPAVSQSDIVPGIRASGSVSFAQDATTYSLGITFNPVSVWFYGAAFRTTTTFTVTAANATAGATYTNNGQTFTVLSTIAGATTLVTVGTGPSINAAGSATTNAAASGTLTKSGGTGDATITFSAATASFGVRAHCVGNAQLGKTYYFQPLTSTSTIMGGPEQTLIQSSTAFLIDSTTSPVTVRAIVDEGDLVDVEYSGIVARATIVSFTNSSVNILTSLAAGWAIVGNYVVT